jgi:hypothetical protein
MNTKFTALALAAVTALSLAPKPVQASDRGLAIVGGFIGGLLVASAINDSHSTCYPERPSAVVVDERCASGGPADGCWNDVAVNVWVPACWVVERGAYGGSCRRYVGGHYERRVNRVWVSRDRYSRYDRRDRDHGDRDHRSREADNDRSYRR